MRRGGTKVPHPLQSFRRARDLEHKSVDGRRLKRESGPERVLTGRKQR